MKTRAVHVIVLGLIAVAAIIATAVMAGYKNGTSVNEGVVGAIAIGAVAVGALAALGLSEKPEEKVLVVTQPDQQPQPAVTPWPAIPKEDTAVIAPK
jgi:hypothetical protein